jgi:hypothetical protein
MNEETEEKPTAPGTRYGQLSDKKQWFWHGTGAPDNGWIPHSEPTQQPVVKPADVPTQFTKPPVVKAHVLCCNPADVAYQTDLSGIPGLTAAVLYTWPRNDIMVRFGV